MLNLFFEFEFLVDECRRDYITAGAVLDGLEAWDKVNYTIRGELFQPWNYINTCKIPSQEIQSQKLKNWVNTLNPLDDHIYVDLQRVMGLSHAPPMVQIESQIVNAT